MNKGFEDIKANDPNKIRRKVPLEEPIFEQDWKLEDIDEIVEEFTRKRYPNEREREKLKKKIIPGADNMEFAQEFNRMTEEFAKIEQHEGELTEDDIPRLKEQWNIMLHDRWGGSKLTLPPFREVNHQMNLIEEEKRYNYHLPRCPDALKPQLSKKIGEYTDSGLWNAVQTNQAAPMLCIPKKDG